MAVIVRSMFKDVLYILFFIFNFQKRQETVDLQMNSRCQNQTGRTANQRQGEHGEESSREQRAIENTRFGSAR